MSNEDLFSITSKLDSSKVKERNEAFDSILTLVNSHRALSKKELLALSESFFSVVANDRIAYAKNDTPAIRDRLERGASILRKLICNDVRNLRSRVITPALRFVRDNLFLYNDEICQPTALDLARMLHELMQVDEHREHLSKDEWQLTTSTIIRALKRLVLQKRNEKVLSELMGCLRCMVLVPMATFDDLSLNLTELLMIYFSNLKKETQATSIALEIVNHTLIYYGASNVAQGFQIIKSVLRVTGRLYSTNFEALYNQLLIFGILAARYISSDIIPLIGEDGEHVPYIDADSKDNLLHWLDKVLAETFASPHALALPAIDMSSKKQRNSWFHLDTFSMSSDSDPKIWMRYVLVTRLLNAFYSLGSAEDREIEQPWKRQRVDNDSYSTILRSCQSPIGFLKTVIISQNPAMQKVGLQLLAFHIDTFRTDTSAISIQDLLIYEQSHIAPWISLALSCMVRHGWTVGNDHLSQLLRINIQMVKEDHAMHYACCLSRELLCIPGATMTDRSLNQLIETLFNVSDVYGPARINNDSIQFWYAISKHSEFINVKGKKTGDLILKWLKAKWLSVSLGDNCDLLGGFLLWLVGCESRIKLRTRVTDNIFSRFGAREALFRLLSDRIMGSDAFFAEPQESVLCIPSCPVVTFAEFVPLIQQIVTFIDWDDESANVTEIMRVVGYGLSLYQGTYNIPELSASSERLKVAITRAMETLIMAPSKPELVDVLCQFDIFNNAGIFISEYIQVDQLSPETGPEVSFSAPVSLLDEFSEFGDVRRQSSRSSWRSLIYTDLSVTEFYEQKVVKMIFNSNSSFDSSLGATIEQVISHLGPLDSHRYVRAFYTVLEILETLDHHKIRRTHIRALFKQCGNKLLGTYDTERSHVSLSLILKFCLMFSDILLARGDKGLIAEFTQIFGFFHTLTQTGTLGAALPLSLFGELLFETLCHDTALEIAEVATFEGLISYVLMHKSNFVYANLSDGFSKYLRTIAAQSQVLELTKFVKSFGSPESSSESAAAFSVFMMCVSDVSYSMFIYVVDFLCCHHQSYHFTRYLGRMLPRLLQNRGQTPGAIPETTLLDLLGLWHDKHQTLVDFPHTLLGYESLVSFVMQNRHLIYAIGKSRQTPSQDTITMVIGLCNVEHEADLMLESMSWSIPLAYTKNGCRSVLVKEMVSTFGDLIEYQDVLIVSRLLQLSDASSESNFLKWIPSAKNKPAASFLLSATSRELYTKVYGISLSDALHQIQAVAKRSDFWTPQVVYFIARNLCCELQKGAAFDDDRVLILRRLKFLLLLSGVDVMSDIVVLALVRHLRGHLSSRSTHDDVSVLLAVLLRGVSDFVSSSLYPESLLWIYEEAVAFSNDNRYINEDLRMVLTSLLGLIDRNDPWRKLFSLYDDVLSGREAHFSHEALHGSLVLVSKSQCKSLETSLFKAISLLLNKSSCLDQLDGLPIHKDIAAFLLRSDHLNHGKLASVFVGRYLGLYYMETGDSLVGVGDDFQRGDEYVLKEKCSSLCAILDVLYETHSSTTDMNEITILESVFAMCIYLMRKRPELMEPLIDLKKHFTDPSKLILPLDAFLFNVISPPEESISDLDSLLGKEYHGDFYEWCSSFSLALIEQLKSDFPLLACVQKCIGAFKETTARLMGLLWILHVYNSGVRAASQLNKFIVQSLKQSQGLERTDKLKLTVEIFYLVEVASRDDKTFSNLFKKIVSSDEITLMCQASISVDRPKFALLLIEKLVISSDEHQTYSRLCKLSEMTKAAFNELSDSDLFHGLPTNASLKAAIELINNNSQGSERQLMFASAEFDASRSSDLSSDLSSSSRENLISALRVNGLDGLTAVVNDYSTNTHKPTSTYDWSWKLGEWDLPLLENPETEGEAIYSLLKSLRDTESSDNADKISQNYILTLLREKKNQSTLLKSLGIVSAFEAINRVGSHSLASNFEKFMTDTEKWFKAVAFSEFEPLLLVRRRAFKNIESRIGTEESTLAVLMETLRYGSYARLHGELQKSLNSTLFLNQLVETNTMDELRPFMSKVTLVDTACTLWSQRETLIPITQLQKCIDMDVSLPESHVPLNKIPLSESHLQSLMVEWNYEARQKRDGDIMSLFVHPALQRITDVETQNEAAGVLFRIANFCFKQAQATTVDELAKKKELLVRKKEELGNVRLLSKDKSQSEAQLKTLARCYRSMSMELESDKEKYDALLKRRTSCVQVSVQCLLQCLAVSDEFDDEAVDKFCALWLELWDLDFVNEAVDKNISLVPLHKFIPWINQLVSRLSSDASSFQRILQEVVANICYRHPWHSLPYLVNLIMHNLYSLSKTDRTVESRGNAARSVWEVLVKRDTTFYQSTLRTLDLFSKQSSNLAREKPRGKSGPIPLENFKSGEFWLKKIQDLQIPLLTMNDLPVSVDGDYRSVPRIVKVCPTIAISTSGLSLPKILKVELTDGSTHKLLFKGGTTDDLRQDAIMQQVFTKVNSILQSEKETRRRSLRIRTYRVVPLGPVAGIIEFVADSIALIDVLKKYHEKDPIKYSEARAAIGEVAASSTRERLSTYIRICKKTTPNFKQFFIDTFLNIDDWYTSRQFYTKGLVTTSMVGHVLGLGDRHLNNILIDKKTGEPIHIDFGVAFDQGKLLTIPETVPFRLTRDMVDALGCTGVEGSFRKGSEHVFRVLRANQEKILGILNVLRYDPLFSWAISPVRKMRLQADGDGENKLTTAVETDGSDAVRALKGVEDKLAAHGLSVEATVQELITEATDVKNLAVIFSGWSAFY